MKKMFTLIAVLALSVGLFAEETILATGPWETQGWMNQPFLLSDGGTELANIGAQAGDVINFYIEPTKEDWAFQIWEGHWGTIYASICAPHLAGTSGYEGCIACDLSVNGGKYALTITQEMIDAALTTQWWGGTFLINGDGVVVTKLTLASNTATTIFVDDKSGLTFRVTDSGEVNNVMVIPNNDESHTYSGDIVIPSTVNYHDTIFTVTEIGSGVFRNCTELTSIIIPNSVTTIRSSAFDYCTGLTSVTIPNSVTTIGENAFEHVNNIVYNGTATGSPWGAKCVNGYVDGYLVYSDASKTTLCACYNAATGEITIPNSVTTIGDYAFDGCSGLTSVTIPNSVTTVGWGAFQGCTSLPVIDNLRYADTYLIETIDKTLSTYTIKEGTKWIGEFAFSGCSNLTTITIPNSVTTIKSTSFQQCSSLISITIPNSVTAIEGWGAFSNCTSLESVIIGNSVKTIGNGTFNGCSRLTSVTIPNSVTKIEAQAFSWSGLKDVSVNWTSSDLLPTMESEVFIGIANTEGPSAATLHVPEGTKSIYQTADQWKEFGTITDGQYNPENCVITYTATEKLTNPYLMIGWTTFGPAIISHTFSNGTGTITCGGEITKIGDMAFAFSGLTSINIPSSVTTIGDYAFTDCYNLTSITIPNSVTTIGEDAFGSCSGLTSITIPNSVTTIGDRAFAGCSGLTSVTIPNSVTTISSNAFDFVNNIVYNGTATGSPWGAKCVNGYIEGYLVYSDTSKTTLCGCATAATGEITIPNSVITIGDYAFSDCSSLTSVTIPNSVTTVGWGAFSGCTSLPIIDNIRYADTYLIEAVDRTLSTYTIKEGTKWIGGLAFEGCSGLTSIIIPNSVIEIEGWGAFANCTSLESVTIGNSVKTIGNGTFIGCSSLTSVTIPNSVTKIEAQAFSWSGLKDVSVNWTSSDQLPTMESEVFIDIANTEGPSAATLHVPEGTKSIYQTADQWKDFGTIIADQQDTKNCVITYTATEKLLEALDEWSGGLHTNAFNVAIISHEFSNGIGTITFAGEVTTIGEAAFYYCYYLTSVTIPNSVTTIGNEAFFACYGLTSVTVHWTDVNKLPSMGDYVFDGIAGWAGPSAATLHVPEGTKSIYQAADVWKEFGTIIAEQQGSKTNVITYTATAKLLETTDYNRSGLHTNAFNVAITSHDFSYGIGTITFAGEVTEIGEKAFLWCPELTSVEIPGSVTKIGNSAFSVCGLITVTIPNSVTTIGERVFEGCSDLTSISVDASNTHYCSMDGILFNYAKDFLIQYPASSSRTEYTIPNSVTTIEAGAFLGCSSLTSITIPNSVTTIGNSAFASCSDLISINVDASNAHYCSVDGVLFNYVKDTLIQYPIGNKRTEYIIPSSVNTIGNQAFEGCVGLTSVTIPHSVTTIGYYAFDGCSGLTSITIPHSVTTIEAGAFHSCSGLTSVVIPNSVTTIEAAAFAYCSGLTSITIPNSVTTIGGYAFVSCSGLTSVTIPNSVKTIEENAFAWNSALTSITIPKSVTKIGAGAFQGSNLTNVTVAWTNKEQLPSMDEKIFENIAGWYGPSAATLHVPEGTKSIYQAADQWKDFGTIIADQQDTKSSVITYTATTKLIETTEVWESGLNTNAFNVEITSHTFSNGTGTITFAGEVTTIGEAAFYECTKLTSITIPNSVTTIGYASFYGCSSLTSITIPNSVTTIGENAFSGCSGLTSVTIPNSVTTIGNNAFFECTGLTSVVIPNSVTTIADYAFLECSNLTSVTIPNSVTTIGESAFGYSGLTSITIPNSVITIGKSAFSSCQLTSITIGNSVKTIGDYAFQPDFRNIDNPILTSIKCFAVIPPSCKYYAFYSIRNNTKIYVLASSLSAYQSTDPWKDFQLLPIGADEKPIEGDEPVVTPTNQDVTITWPITDGTNTYTLTISSGGEVVCVLTFNANGQLTNIAFAAPSHDGSRQAPTATLTAQGYQFTVIGLNPGTAYEYSVTATDAQGETLAEHNGNFSTTGDAITNINQTRDTKRQTLKYLHNGQLLIDRNGKHYSAMGERVR